MHHQGLLGVVLDGVLGTSARSAQHLAVSLSLSSYFESYQLVLLPLRFLPLLLLLLEVKTQRLVSMDIWVQHFVLFRILLEFI